MELTTKTSSNWLVYMPKPIREIVARDMLILPGVSSLVLHRKDATPQAVLDDLEIIAAELKLRKKLNSGDNVT